MKIIGLGFAFLIPPSVWQGKLWKDLLISHIYFLFLLLYIYRALWMGCHLSHYQGHIKHHPFDWRLQMIYLFTRKWLAKETDRFRKYVFACSTSSKETKHGHSSSFWCCPGFFFLLDLRVFPVLLWRLGRPSTTVGRHFLFSHSKNSFLLIRRWVYVWKWSNIVKLQKII